MGGFDLGQVKAVAEREDQGRMVHIRDEAGRPMYDGEKPVSMTVVGTYSSRYRRALEAMQDRRLQRRQPSDSEQVKREAIELVAQCIVSWEGFYDAGKPAECTKGNVAKVLELAPWVRDQVESAMEDHAGFSLASSGS